MSWESELRELGTAAYSRDAIQRELFFECARCELSQSILQTLHTDGRWLPSEAAAKGRMGWHEDGQFLFCSLGCARRFVLKPTPYAIRNSYVNRY